MNRPTAVVIGIGPGLGQALVRAFALDGFNVAFVGRRQEAVAEHEAEMRAEGMAVAGFVGDASKPDVMDPVFAAIADRFGPAEVLIYNAATIEPARFTTSPAIEHVQYGEAAGWDARTEPADFAYLVDTFRTNVAGAHHAATRVVPDMIARGRGSILLTGGVLAFDPWIEWGVTALGKAALRSLGHSLFKELGPHGVQATTVAIHGTMQAGTAYDHDVIARAYLDVHKRPQAEWTPDFHFR
ncbi:SDR family NAD(P)-dependent oxidoreductase [Thalassorhabdomicrobium marinisediminis]|uniref:SDR family NAD(P)-dependent oxidoreductase n=1 Tax=Thalassorhabdomicrobium marinisediminis TaxID=2170577 RepID=UPI00249295AF|nr:SDR family NAD(P)-dependent oxidoreductase [Thalassorhabdomicrobium marinisediminis]